jgi:hypothetical protein
MKTTTAEVVADIKSQIDSLQVWFASRPYGWRERATAEQLRQWDDRVREEEYLLGRLEMLDE